MTSDKQIVPYSYNVANGLDGALQLGLNCMPYFNVSEIYKKYDKGDIILDGIDQVQYCLDKFQIKTDYLNYPEVLQPYMGRKFWYDTINHINNHPELWGNFVKPVKEKAFTGRVINSTRDLVGCGSIYEDYEVLVSEPLNFMYECRGFIYYDEIIDFRPYKGNYKYMRYVDTELISKAMEDWKTWKERPNSCSLDWGIVLKQDGSFQTVFIEANKSLALGAYGLYSINYIKLISAYISQISKVEDELHF